MAYSNIDKPSKYFNTLTYTGDASSPRTVTGVGFKPDFTWIKNRSRAGSSALNDNVRGVGTGVYKELSTETNNSEGNNGGSGYGYLSAFASDGFTLTQGSVAYDIVNRSGDSYVSWNWLGSNTTTSNTSGSITSTVSVNTTAGISIGTFTGTGSNATIGHGLNSVPKFLWVKNRSSSGDWMVYHQSTGNTKAMFFNSNNTGATSSTYWQDTTPTSSVFSIGSNGNLNTNGNNHSFVAFAEVKGFSKFGTYTGNGSSSGNFIYTGFKPAFVLIKSTSSTDNWFLIDNKRDGYNKQFKLVTPNTNGAEDTAYSGTTDMDLLSNGFRLTTNWSGWNNSGQTNIYMAFAESPFVSSKGIPTTAR